MSCKSMSFSPINSVLFPSKWVVLEPRITSVILHHVVCFLSFTFRLGSGNSTLQGPCLSDKRCRRTSSPVLVESPNPSSGQACAAIVDPLGLHPFFVECSLPEGLGWAKITRCDNCPLLHHARSQTRSQS